ncbi:uncharacterized protein LOC144196314 isoform X2 [Stigmatopora nigra]
MRTHSRINHSKVGGTMVTENTFILLKTVPEGSATCWSKTPPTCGHGSRTSLMVANIRRRLTQDQSQTSSASNPHSKQNQAPHPTYSRGAWLHMHVI